MIYHRNSRLGFDLAECVEGDVTAYRYPMRAMRDQATDQLAWFHWEHQGEEWVRGVANAGAMPAKLRGPFSWQRLEWEDGGLE